MHRISGNCLGHISLEFRMRDTKVNFFVSFLFLFVVLASILNRTHLFIIFTKFTEIYSRYVYMFRAASVCRSVTPQRNSRIPDPFIFWTGVTQGWSSDSLIGTLEMSINQSINQSINLFAQTWENNKCNRTKRAWHDNDVTDSCHEN